MEGDPDIFTILDNESLYNLSTKIDENTSRTCIFSYDTLHDEINTHFTVEDITNKKELENNMLTETKKGDENILQLWKNLNVLDIDGVLKDIIKQADPGDKNYICYIRDVFKGSIISGLNNLLDMAGSSNEIYIKQRSSYGIDHSLPLEPEYTHYFKFDIKIRDYIRMLIPELQYSYDYKEYNKDNLNFFWQYLLCYCYLSIKNDECEKSNYSKGELCMVFYILRNICFCSFKIIKGFNSIEYIRYPEWKIGHQDEENSLRIYSFSIKSFGQMN